MIAQLLFLESEDPAAGIRLVINSLGGSVISALAIVDTLHWLKCPIATVCVGRAAGAATLVLACGSPGLRSATANARISLSRTTAAAASVEIALELQRLEDTQLQLIEKATGRPASQLAVDLEAQRSFSVDEARDYGLIDKIGI